MSKLREQLNAQVFPVYIPKPIKPLMDYVDSRGSIDNTGYDERIVIEARIHMATTVTRDVLESHTGMRDSIIKRMKDAIIEEVFGEFNKPLRDLRFAIYRNDEVTALKILNKLMDQMYNEA